MRAAVVTVLAGPDGVVIREVPDPTPAPGQVLSTSSMRASAFQTSSKPGASTKCAQSCHSHLGGRSPVWFAKPLVDSAPENAFRRCPSAAGRPSRSP